MKFLLALTAGGRLVGTLVETLVCALSLMHRAVQRRVQPGVNLYGQLHQSVCTYSAHAPVSQDHSHSTWFCQSVLRRSSIPGSATCERGESEVSLSFHNGGTFKA